MARKKINWSLIGSAFIALMFVFSSIAFITMGGLNRDTSNTIKYKGFTMVSDSLGVHAKLKNKNVDFTYLPSDVESKFSSEAIAKILSSKNVQFTADPNDLQAEYIGQITYQLRTALKEELQIDSTAGFIEENTQNIRVIKCENSSIPTVFIHTNTENKDEFISNCYSVSIASPSDAVIFRDRLMYSIFGVI